MTRSADPLGLIGRTIADKYLVEYYIGEGGFAVVYRAEHTIWRLPVAIKLFNALELAPGEQQRELEHAFVNEGALMTRLSAQTSAIVQARDVGSYETRDGKRIPFLVLEWVDGTPLDQILDRERAAGKKPWTLDQVRRFLAPVAAAVDVVHEHGVAHRDLKPANILVVGGDPRNHDAAVKILHFGVAKMMLDNSRFQAALAATGQAVTAFTPHYGAPEQFSRRFGATGPWTDVYALALIAVELLAGREALHGRDVAELSAASSSSERRPTPRSLGVTLPDGVEAVFAQALAVRPENRFARARDFWSAFEAALATFPSPASLSSAPPPAHAAPAAPPNGVRIAVAAAVAGALLIAVALAAGAWFSHSKAPSLGLAPSAAAERALPPPPAPSASAAAASCPRDAVRIAAAEFFMGSDHKHSPGNEHPAHQVALSPFCLDRREITVARYKACVDAGKCREAPIGVEWPGMIKKERIIYGAACNAPYEDRGAHPMNCVDHALAESFCAAEGGRLPTEAEWEFAARGPSVTRYPWGDNAPNPALLNACDLACKRWGQRNDVPVKTLFTGLDAWPTTAPAGSFARGRSRLGLDDLAGNVREWVGDWYAPYPAERQTDPRGPASGERRVTRGSAWNTGENGELGRGFRLSEVPGARRHDLGFRCAYQQSP